MDLCWSWRNVRYRTFRGQRQLRWTFRCNSFGIALTCFALSLDAGASECTPCEAGTFSGQAGVWPLSWLQWRELNGQPQCLRQSLASDDIIRHYWIREAMIEMRIEEHEGRRDTSCGGRKSRRARKQGNNGGDSGDEEYFLFSIFYKFGELILELMEVLDADLVR
jgi:hypothetical protein